MYLKKTYLLLNLSGCTNVCICLKRFVKACDSKSNCCGKSNKSK